jgi:hypothetical protein
MSEEKSKRKNSKIILRESIIKENENQCEYDTIKKDLTDNSIAPIINEISMIYREEFNKDNRNNSFKDIFDFKLKKMKLINIYNSLMKLRENLLIKEKELTQKEKNLIEFEKVLKLNENILKNNIDQFDKYIKNKIDELKNQFLKIEQIQKNKEKYLNQRIKEIINYENRYHLNSKYINNENNNSNIKCLNCDSSLYNEQEIIEPFIDTFMKQNRNEIEMEENDNNFSNENQQSNSFCDNCFKIIHNKGNNIIEGQNSFANESKLVNIENNIQRLKEQTDNNFLSTDNKCECPDCQFYSL